MLQGVPARTGISAGTPAGTGNMSNWKKAKNGAMHGRFACWFRDCWSEYHAEIITPGVMGYKCILAEIGQAGDFRVITDSFRGLN
jgi:hypothetical protein